MSVQAAANPCVAAERVALESSCCRVRWAVTIVLSKWSQAPAKTNAVKAQTATMLSASATGTSAVWQGERSVAFEAYPFGE